MGFIPKKGDVLLYVKETTPGAGGTPSRVIGIVESAAGITFPQHDRGLGVKHGLCSTGPQFFTEGVQSLTGASVSFYVQRPEFLEYIIGTAVDSAGPGPYTHTMTADDILDTICIGVARKDVAGTVVLTEKYIGCVITEIALEAAKGDRLKCNMKFAAMTSEVDTSSLSCASMTGETPLFFKGSSITVGGDTIANPLKFSFSVKRTISTSTVLNSTVPIALTAENWTASSSLSFLITTQDEMNKYHGATGGTRDAEGTDYAVNFALTNGLLTTSLRKLEILGPVARLGSFKMSGFDEHAKADMATQYTSITIIATDNTANWVA